MTPEAPEDVSREALIRELQKLRTVEHRLAARAGDDDRERIIHDLQVQLVELEMQNCQLRDAEERREAAMIRWHADLYDLAPVGHCVLDAEGRIRGLNLAAAALLGAPREALLGSPSVVPFQEVFSAHVRRCLAVSGPVTSEVTLSVEKRGTRIVQLTSARAGDQSVPTTTWQTILVDVSDLRDLENRLRLLSKAGERLSSSVESGVLLAEAARIAVPDLSDVCLIDLASESGAPQRQLVLFADPQKQATLADRLMRASVQVGSQTPQARVIASGQPLLLADLSVDQRDGLFHDDNHDDALRAADVRSLMVVPLQARGRTFGALTLASAESDRRFSPMDLHVAQDLSGRIALSLDNAQRASVLLRRSEAKFAGIVSISPDAVISIDKDHRIALFNTAAEVIFGYSQAEAIGSHFEALIPERFRAIHRQHLERFMSGAQGTRRMGDQRASIFGLRKNGEEFPVDAAVSSLEVDGEMILTVTLRDVTDARRRERHQGILADMGTLLVGTLDYDETLTKLADLAVRELADFCMIDLVEDDAEIRRLRVVGRDPSKQWICNALTRTTIDRSRPGLVGPTLETGRPTLIETVTPEVIASWAHNDDYLRLLQGMEPRSIVVVPLLARGKILGVLKIVSATRARVYGREDVRLMEQVAYRAALAIDNAQLHRAAERAIQARDAMLGVVAHDLRNPLTGIDLSLAVLERQPREPERGSHKVVEAMRRSVTRMTRMIEDLLDVVRMDAGHLSLERTPVHAGNTLSAFVESQQPLAASRSVELKLDAAPDTGEVFADQDRLLQVLENLVGNAVRFTASCGCVTVGAAPQNGEVRFWVKDTGAGITSNDLSHIFDRFWQARKVGRQGIGLGLSIVQGIVQAHGGRIWVESQVGAGSTFSFTIPLANPEPMAVLLAPSG